jgi:hypothetical protein
VMTDLVSNHVGFRELAGLAPHIAHTKASLKILKEICVEIDLFIDWAIEWAIAAFAFSLAMSKHPIDGELLRVVVVLGVGSVAVPETGARERHIRQP